MVSFEGKKSWITSEGELVCQAKDFGSEAVLIKGIVGTLILSHTDLACNTSYHFVASRMVFPRVPPYMARDYLRLLAHVYDSVASIHMTENPGRHD